MSIARPRKRDGTPIDPVPFLVVVLTTFLITHAWGPLYFLALGFSVAQSLAVVTVLFAVATVVAYRQLVWTAHPLRQAEVPAEQRIKRLVYAIPIGIGSVLLLSLPFVH